MRYYFHVQDGHHYPDLVGHELPTLDVARTMAVETAGTFLRDHRDAFWIGEEWRMVVTDDRGMIMFTLDVVGTMAPAGSLALQNEGYGVRIGGGHRGPQVTAASPQPLLGKPDSQDPKSPRRR